MCLSLLDNEEVSSIQNQLNSLKLNPYPELKVISEDNDTSPPTNTDASSYLNQESGTTATLNAKEISNCLSDAELASSTSSSPPFQQLPPTAPYSHQLDPSASAAYGYQQNSETNGLSAQQLHQMQFLAQHQMPPMGQQGQAYAMDQQQQQQPMKNVALQFMQAMQQSVHQVANAPHFGFEWVKPDYQFDPVTTFTESGHCEQQVQKNPLKTSPATSVDSPPLTERDMDELYNVLEGYNGQDAVAERLLTTDNTQQ